MDEAPKRPPIAQSPLSAILYLTPHTAAAHLQNWLRVLQEHGTFELLVVGAATRLEADRDLQQLRAEQPHLRLVQQVWPQGLGPALETGLRLAAHPLLLIAPCDHQYDPAQLTRLFEFIDQVDVVTGYRVRGRPPVWLRVLDLGKRLLLRILLGYMPEPRTHWLGWSGFWRRVLQRHIFGLQVRDAECAFRLYRRSLFARIPIQSQGTFVHVEILAKANHLGAWIMETAVDWTPPSDEPLSTEDMKRVLRDPDFGPAVLPPEPA